MVETQALEDMGEDDVLAFADACAEAARRAEVDLLRAAYQWAVLHDPARLDPSESGKPGREKARRLGGEGTAEVTEFAAAQFGARISRSPFAAAQLIADAQDLRHRHPELWARVEAGEVRSSYARFVTTKTRDLSEDAAAYVDAAVAESADGRIPWTRFEMLVEAKVAAAAPHHARAKEEQARKARFAKMLRGDAHGMGSFLIRADIATIEQFNAAVTALAARLAETMPDSTDDERRVRAVLLLANPGASPETSLADLLPLITLFVHMYGGSTSTPDEPGGPEAEHDPETGPAGRIARVEGHGPVTEHWIRDVLGPQARFRIVPVVDLGGQAPVDAYEIPDRHRQAVHLMTPADTFPFASSLSRAQLHLRTKRNHRMSTRSQGTAPAVSPDQDPRWLAGPATLPGDLRLARPPRRALHRGPHRDPAPRRRREGRLRLAHSRDVARPADPPRLGRRLS